MSDPAEVSTRSSSSMSKPLSRRVLTALTIALLPIGLISAGLSAISYDDAYRESIALIERRAVRLADEVDNIITDEGLALRAFSLRLDLDDNLNTCEAALTRIVDLEPMFESVSQIDASGRVTCRSPGGPDLNAQEARYAAKGFREDNGRPGELFFDAARRNVIFAVRDRTAVSTPSGIAAVIPLTALQARLNEVSRPAGSRLAVQVTREQPTSLEMPEPIVVSDGRYGFRAPTRINGLMIEYDEPVPAFSARRLASIIAPPVMWLAALAIAWLTLRRLVIRPLRTMQAGIDERARSGVVDPLEPRVGNTAEFAAFAASYDSLADKQRRDREDREAALEKQQRLVREVHHRVKNNLQIITSLLSIKARDTNVAGERRAYGIIQMRVEALALVHRWLYADDHARGVDVGALLNDLLASLESSIENVVGVAVHLTNRFDRVFVGQDAAVPLSFLITELLAGEAARLEPGLSMEAHVELLRMDEGHGMLTISGDDIGGATLSGDGLRTASGRIVQGMTRQLRGELSYDEDANTIMLSFRLGNE